MQLIESTFSTLEEMVHKEFKSLFLKATPVFFNILDYLKQQNHTELNTFDCSGDISVYTENRKR
jgi:hypothetical protein